MVAYRLYRGVSPARAGGALRFPAVLTTRPFK